MDKYDLLEAMGGIRDRYVEEAGGPAASGQSGAFSFVKEEKKKAGRRGGRRAFLRLAAPLAALVCLALLVRGLLPGIFDRGPAESGYVTGAEDMKVLEEGGESFALTAAEGQEARITDSKNVTAADQETSLLGSGPDTQAEGTGLDSAYAGGTAGFEAWGEDPEEGDLDPAEAGLTDLREILYGTDLEYEALVSVEKCITDYQDSISGEAGSKTLSFDYAILTEPDGYLCMAVTTRSPERKGFEQTDHFVFEKETGKRVLLADLFERGADYAGPISDNLLSQMRERMEADPEEEYWCGDQGDTGTSFRRIRPDQDFYLDEEGNLVICFDKLEAGPEKTGAPEFTIPKTITDGI